MTRPPQPRPYPGDAGGQAPLPRPPYRRTFTDAAGQSLDGEAIIRTESGSIRVPIVAGELSVDLQPGTYELLATLSGPGGVSYETGTFKVEAYW